MNNKISYFLSFPFLVYGLFFCIEPESKLLLPGLIIIFIGLVCFFLKDIRIINYLFSISIFLYILIAIEVYYLAIQPELETFCYYNKSCAKFDKKSGYKWYGDNIRVVRTTNKEIIFDNTFTPNNYGYITKHNFFEKKTNKNKTRLLILGDSFSAGSNLSTNMPDKLQEILNKKTNNKYEIYSFSVDGGGLFNWHSIFFNEIVDNFEFDGVILAVYGGDLWRDFTIFHSNDSTLKIDRFNKVPENNYDFEKNYYPKMKLQFKIRSNEEINEHLLFDNKQYTFKLYFLRKLISAYRNIKKSYLSKKTNSNKIVNIDTKYVLKKLGADRLKKLNNIVDYCKANDKTFYFATIPKKDNLLKGDTIELEQEILSNHLKVNYFNGYKVFSKLNKNEILSNYLNHDGHWNINGSNKFAEYYSNYILNQ